MNRGVRDIDNIDQVPIWFGGRLTHPNYFSSSYETPAMLLHRIADPAGRGRRNGRLNNPPPDG